MRSVKVDKLGDERYRDDKCEDERCGDERCLNEVDKLEDEK